MAEKEKRRHEIKRLLAENGLSDFTDENVIELLLFYATSKQETIQIAQRLIQTYGSFSAVLEAPASDMLRVEGMNNEGAQFLSLIGQVARRCELIKAREITRITSPEDAAEYVIPLFLNERSVILYIICLDEDRNIIATKGLSPDAITKSNFTFRQVAQVAVSFHASSVVLCQNHPGDSVDASSFEKSTAVQIKSAMATIGIPVYDYIIISGREYTSLRESGVMMLTEVY